MSTRILKGVVSSDKMQKTVVVSIELDTKHAKYGKAIRNTKRVKAHNDLEAKLGQLVKVEECAPISKNVTWKVIEIVNTEAKK
jgi:small subunit ribosomal protein S17